MAVTTEIEPGLVLADRFRVRGRLGAGGTATVFLAEDCVLCRDVAIKRLHTEGSETDVRRFRREARLGASLIHPNLVTIFDTLSGPDGVLIVMEHVRGRPLSDLITPAGMDPRRVLEILRPVASALDHAHTHGVVHRDVKPANILIAEDHRVKLVDLGTATAGHLAQITAENELVGTLAYIAPERLAGESVGEPAADVYSLAVVAFEALTGRPPHKAKTPGELLARQLSGGTSGGLEAPSHLPARLRRVLMQGMHPDPERRQGSTGAFIRDLEGALPDPDAATRMPTFPPTEPITVPVEEHFARRPPQSPWRRARSRWLLPALCGLVALLAIGIVLTTVGGGGGDSRNEPGRGEEAIQKPDGGGFAPDAASAATASAGGSPPATASSTTTASPGTADAPTSGAQLNDEGYSLIQQGRYVEAIPVLRRAVRSFPADTTDINYAYALFNLGHALRMAGRPERAIPILERRLRIPDQTETVEAELAAASAAAGE